MEFGNDPEEEFGLIDDDAGNKEAKKGQQLKSQRLTLEEIGLERVVLRLKQKEDFEALMNFKTASSSSDSLSLSSASNLSNKVRAKPAGGGSRMEDSASILDAHDESLKEEKSTSLA